MAADATEKPRKTVVLADDHALVRSATRQIIESIAATAILAEVENGLEAMAAVRKHRPDLLVLDAAMPYANGIEVFTEARRWSPDTRIVILTGLTSVNLHAEWIDVGADGLLLKSCEPEEIRECFETVLAGHKFVAKSVADMLKDAADPVPLTAREREILSLISTGHSNATIADRLCISIKTVEKHRGGLMAKLGVTSVAELFAYALKEGLLESYKQL